MASKFAVASCSLCPPDKNTMPGTAAGTVLCKAVTVAFATASLPGGLLSLPANSGSSLGAAWV